MGRLPNHIPIRFGEGVPKDDLIRFGGRLLNDSAINFRGGRLPNENPIKFGGVGGEASE